MFVKQRKFPEGWLLLSIFGIALALRVLAITVPINVDELVWMERGTGFIENFLEDDLGDTYRRHHPGVTNSWLIAVGMLLNCHLHLRFPSLFGLDSVSNLEECLNIDSFPLPLLIAPRVLQALVTSACMVFFYVFSRRLLGPSIALLATILLVLDPFFLAYQRFLTTDALQVDFCILALLLLLLYLQGKGDWRSLLASGILMGLATASKITALFVLPAIFLWIIFIELGVWQQFPQRGWRRQLIALTCWGLSTVAIIFVIWPALWQDAGETLTRLTEGLLQESSRGYLFFLGEPTDAPGILFYPLALVYRLSPWIQLGLLSFLITLIVPHRRSLQSSVLALAIVPLCVLTILSTTETKIDRYILLILPELALLAAAGWLSVSAWLSRIPWFRQRKYPQGIGALLLIVGQTVILVPHVPHYLTYYNPLFGGSQAAQRIFMVGQGEGLEQAAYWLNQQGEDLTVASGYSNVFGTYFQGQALPMSKRITSEDYLSWTKANYVVLYINQWQRQLPYPEVINYFTAQPPLHTVQLQGIDYARIYPGPVPLPKDIEQIPVPLSLNFGDQGRLLGYGLNQDQLSPAQMGVTLYWHLSSLDEEAVIRLGLLDRGGNYLVSTESGFLNGYLAEGKPDALLRDVHWLNTSTLSPGRYRLALEWFSHQQDKITEDSQSNRVVIGEVEVL
ncbi:MAG: ArnT family glycosyltransferase [Cyanophyceae cyanobacterium]